MEPLRPVDQGGYIQTVTTKLVSCFIVNGDLFESRRVAFAWKAFDSRWWLLYAAFGCWMMLAVGWMFVEPNKTQEIRISEAAKLRMEKMHKTRGPWHIGQHSLPLSSGRRLRFHEFLMRSSVVRWLWQCDLPQWYNSTLWLSKLCWFCPSMVGLCWNDVSAYFQATFCNTLYY